MGTNAIFTSLLGGWPKTADKAAAATIHYAKSTVMPSVCDLTQRAALATGKTLNEVGCKLTSFGTSK